MPIQVTSIEKAIRVTMQKYSYREDQKRQIYEELEKGNFDVITSDYGARKFVKEHYQKKNQMASPFKDFTSLTKFFDDILNRYGIPKENQYSFPTLYNELLQYMNDPNQKGNITELMVEAAKQYSKEVRQHVEVLRHPDFSTPDLTRKEAVDLTSIYSNMEHQKHQVTEALSKYPVYQRQLLTNLVAYSYYENDFSISLEDQIKSSQK